MLGDELSLASCDLAGLYPIPPRKVSNSLSQVQTKTEHMTPSTPTQDKTHHGEIGYLRVRISNPKRTPLVHDVYVVA